MKMNYRIILHFAVLTAFCWHTNSIPNTLSWFEAQSICRERNQTLTLKSNESTDFYWTGFYKRLSHWIKIIGCYNSSTLKYNISTNLSLLSPPLCQEYCLQRSFYVFAVQSYRCLCLSRSGFRDDTNHLNPSECTYTCNDTTLLSTECGGESAFSVFRTDTSMLGINSSCLSIQCGNDSKLYGDIDCNNYLNTRCTNNSIEKSEVWKVGFERCKSRGTYLLWNITLTNITSACTNSIIHVDQRWIGVVKDLYLSKDYGEVITSSDYNHFNTCQKCKNNKGGNFVCHFVSCTEQLNKGICTESVAIPQTETTDLLGSTETTESIINTPQNDNSSIQVVVPVVIAFLVILCVFAVAVFIYIRRKKDSKNNDKKGGSVPTTKNAGSYSNTELENDKNYFVLQQSNPTYELADNSKTESESPYNEAEDGTYDHLEDKDARKIPANGIYNNASSGGLSDLSDYDVTNRKNESSEGNTYDRTGVRDDSYGKFKSGLSDYDVANRKHLNEEDSTYDRAEAGDNSYGKFNLYQVKETDYSE
ncbi:uncharacterized protein [Magallana gigas]|uniref:uncharacterized protein isoform X2 n=1 Tax=Magallana gigas TaxID=29159 RepID=UPI003340098D